MSTYIGSWECTWNVSEPAQARHRRAARMTCVYAFERQSHELLLQAFLALAASLGLEAQHCVDARLVWRFK